MYEKHGLFIDGVWRAKGGHGTVEVTDPATGEVLGLAPVSYTHLTLPTNREV